MERDYLFRRKQSRYWQLRLETPRRVLPNGVVCGEASTKMLSTGCERYEDALDFSLPQILEHRRTQAFWRAHVNFQMADERHRLERTAIDIKNSKTDSGIGFVFVWQVPPGEKQMKADGGYYQASPDGKHVAEFDAEANFLRSFDNKSRVEPAFELNAKEHRAIRELEDRLLQPKREIDEEIFLNWSEGRFGTRGKIQSEAIQKDGCRALKRLQFVAPKKTLATIGSLDARAMVRLMIDAGCSSETMKKQVGHLKAMTNAAIHANRAKEGNFPAIKVNVWTTFGLVPEGHTGNRSRPTLFSIEEEEAILAALPNWDWQSKLLWTFLYHTGARVGEPFHVAEEESRHGHRCFRYGSKTVESYKRLVPIPPALLALPGFPDKVEGPLFNAQQDKVVWTMMELVRSVEIDGQKIAAVGTGRTAASLRPRFITLAHGRGGDKDVINAITGHVPDNFGANEEEANTNKRNRQGIFWRYMRGHHPKRLLDVMELASKPRGFEDL